jgi:hypothetical protein
VRSAKEYRWSSFRAFYFESDEPLPVDHEWWWPDDAEKLSQAVKKLGWKTYQDRNDFEARRIVKQGFVKKKEPH